jgi:hypothetical protein
VGVYVAYRPQRLIFEDAVDHPTQLVESAAMASVALPAPSYVPQLPAKVIRDRVLSRAQLETLVHALDATSSDLPGRYRVPERGLELVPDAKAPATGAASSSVMALALAKAVSLPRS